MSKTFLTKLAGGVVLGSAALLLAAPATALAANDGPTKEPKNSNQEWQKSSDDKGSKGDKGKDDRDSKSDKGKDDKDSKDDKTKDDKTKTFTLRDKEGNGVICATNDQNAEAGVAQTISNNTISGGLNVFNQVGAAGATNDNAQDIVVCIRDLDIDVNVERNLLNDILRTVEAARASGANTPLGRALNPIPALGGVYAGPNGAWVLPANGGVAAGDGGALSGANTGALVTTGAGMMGVAALAGIGLLRRRSADGTVA